MSKVHCGFPVWLIRANCTLARLPGDPRSLNLVERLVEVGADVEKFVGELGVLLCSVSQSSAD